MDATYATEFSTLCTHLHKAGDSRSGDVDVQKICAILKSMPLFGHSAALLGKRL
jgi:hypothetical protein